MNKKVIDYIVNLDTLNVNKKRGIILIDEEKVKSTDCQNVSSSSCEIYKYLIDKTPVYAKAFSVDTPFAMGTSRMLNECQIATPISSPIINYGGDACFVATQDLHDIGRKLNLETMSLGNWFLGKQLTEHHLKTKRHIDPKWQLFTDKKAIEKFQKYCEDNVLDQINTMLLLQELTNYTDGHRNNYIAFVDPKTQKLAYLSPIDLDYNEMLTSKNENYKEAFNDFLQRPYFSCTILNQFDDEQTYPERIKNITKLIHSGKVKNTQIQTLKTALNYDLSKSIQKEGKTHHLSKKFTPSVEMSKYLWDYNRKHLGREIGL